MEKVKVGATVVIEGTVYRFSSTAARVYNELVELLGGGREEDLQIHLFTKNQYGKEGRSIRVSKIKDALEKQDWNKTPHGL